MCMVAFMTTEGYLSCASLLGLVFLLSLGLAILNVTRRSDAYLKPEDSLLNELNEAEMDDILEVEIIERDDKPVPLEVELGSFSTKDGRATAAENERRQNNNNL